MRYHGKLRVSVSRVPAKRLGAVFGRHGSGRAESFWSRGEQRFGLSPQVPRGLMNWEGAKAQEGKGGRGRASGRGGQEPKKAVLRTRESWRRTLELQMTNKTVEPGSAGVP